AFELRGDSAADARDAALRLDGGADALAWHFDALKRDSGEYEVPGPGVVENSAVETAALALGGSWIGESSLFGVAVSRYDTLYGVPGHRHDGHDAEEGGNDVGHADDADNDDHADHDAGLAAAGEARARIDLAQTRIDLKGRWRNLGGAIEEVGLRVGLNDYEHVELEGAAMGTRFTNDASEARLTLSHAP